MEGAEVQPWTDGDISYRIVMLATLVDLALEELKRTKGIAASRYSKGTTIPAWTANADGEDIKLGSVNKSNPKPKAEVRDAMALDAYIVAEFEDELERDVVLGDPGAILPVLIEAGRRDLFSEVRVIPDWLRKRVVTSALNGKDVPGVEVVRPSGTVSATKDRAAVEEVRRLLSGARVPLLGIEA